MSRRVSHSDRFILVAFLLAGAALLLAAVLRDQWRYEREGPETDM